MAKAAGILIAHGSKAESWKDPFEQILRLCRAKKSDIAWHLCFLEYTSPTMQEVGSQLGRTLPSETQVHLFPLFFAEGKHVKIDIPNFLQQMKTEYPAINWKLHQTVGILPTIQEAMATHISAET